MQAAHVNNRRQACKVLIVGEKQIGEEVKFDLVGAKREGRSKIYLLRP
jgi:hypothetical protein